LQNSFKFQINQEIIDERDNFIILDINIQDSRMTLVAIYGPFIYLLYFILGYFREHGPWFKLNNNLLKNSGLSSLGL
jgi:hypothetical protein